MIAHLTTLVRRQGIFLLMLLFLAACNSDPDKQTSVDKDSSQPAFLQIGSFSVQRVSASRIDVRDGAGRTLVLIERGSEPPSDVPATNVIEIPVQRVAAYGYFEVCVLRALGVLESALVGVTTPKERWYVPEVKQGMEQGKIAFLGDASKIDFERLQQQQPELVLTWDPAIIPMLDQLGIACVVTTTPEAMCLNARMRFVQFLAPFFHKEQEAEAFFNRIRSSLDDIRARTIASHSKPKVMWGDVYEKRVLVEPGNAWVGELVGLARSNYQFDDIFGTSCIEITLERFLYSGQDADILFTYRDINSGATSKEALARMNPLIKDIAPLHTGRVYSPKPHYTQSGDHLDEILTEIAAILHPDVYPDYPLRYFNELPDTDPATGGKS